MLAYLLMDMYAAKSFETAYIWPVAWRKYLFPCSPNFQYSGSWYLTPLDQIKRRLFKTIIVKLLSLEL